MSLELYLAFVAATLILTLIPGPNTALIVANSVAHGRRYGLVTVAGTTSAMVPQLTLTVAGMSAALSLVAHLLEWVRWAGAAYLLYLAVQAWRAAPVDLTRTDAEPRSARRIYARGFLVSLTNPKTLLFYGSLFPQFVSPSGSIVAQLALLSVTFIALALVMDSLWAVLSARFRQALAVNGRTRNRVTAGFYSAAAIGLAGARTGG